MNSSNKHVIMAVMFAAIASLFMGGIAASTAYADKTIQNTCKTDETGHCSFDQIFKQGKGTIRVENNIDVSNSIGHDGNVSTVDQVARDRISGLDTRVNDLKNTNDGLQQTVTGIQQNDTIQDNNIGSLQAENEALRTNIAELNATLQNAIVDIFPSGNVTVPADNGTGGNVTEPVVCQPGWSLVDGACVEDVVIPPINETDTGNETGTETNSTG